MPELPTLQEANANIDRLTEEIKKLPQSQELRKWRSFKKILEAKLQPNGKPDQKTA